MSWFEAHRMAEACAKATQSQHWVALRPDGTYNVYGVESILWAVRMEEKIIARYVGR